MDRDQQKGMLCGLLAAGLRMEGLLRVAMERPETCEEIAPQIREAFALYAGIFNQVWAEPDPSVADEAEEIAEVAPMQECIAHTPDETIFIPDEEEPEEEKEEEATEPETIEEAEEEVVEFVAPEPVRVIEVCPAAPVAPVAPAAPLSDALKVDELIARKESADLRRAFTLNDKFRFRRTLFGGSDALFSEVLDALEAMGSFEQAERYLAGVIDCDCEDAEDFMNIISAHFGSRS